MGFAPNQLLMLTPWFAGAGAACGVYFDHRSQLANHADSVVQNWIGWKGFEGRLRDAPHFESRLHMVSYKLSSYDVRVEVARRTACVRFLLRSLSRFFARMPRTKTPMSEKAVGASALRAIQDRNALRSLQIIGDQRASANAAQSVNQSVSATQSVNTTQGANAT